MSDPKRLIDRLESGAERDLMLLGASERAPDGARDRIEARVLEIAAAAAVGSAVATGTGGATAGKTGSILLLGLKWLSVGAVVGGVTALGGSEIATRFDASRAPEPTQPAALAVQKTEALSGAVPPADTTMPEIDAVPAPREVPSASKRSGQGDVKIGESSTLLENQTWQRAKAERKRDPDLALRLCNAYIARFPDGAHISEAKRLQSELVSKDTTK